MKKRYLIFIILLVLVAGCGKKSNTSNTKVETNNKVEEEKTNNYVAYVKNDATIKLEYSQTCKGDDCTAPTVTSYTLLNDKAKELFTETELLDDDKDLTSVINKIYTKEESKGIKVDTTEIETDWSGMSDYIKKTSNSNLKYVPTVKKSSKATIESNISSDVETENKIKEDAAAKAKAEAEAKAKAEAEAKAKKAAEAKAKAEAEAKAKKAAEEKAKAEAAAKKAAEEKAASTIKLSDNVTYTHTMISYECDNCFSQTLINTLKSAKGHSVTEATSSRITIKTITKLSGKYDTASYKGNDLTSKITAAGGKEVGGAGGSDEAVTKKICTEYKLVCE